jgi:hypothetical protein
MEHATVTLNREGDGIHVDVTATPEVAAEGRERDNDWASFKSISAIVRVD